MKAPTRVALSHGVYPSNLWYVAAFGNELTSVPLARTICGKPVALFRTQAGRAVAVEDRCCHRGMPLTAGGECSGEVIRCPYHGLEFDPTGACVNVPGQDHIPPRARILAYPIVEQEAFVWIWVGDATKADPSRIPSFPDRKDASWAWSTCVLKMECDWQLLNDNLLDLTHVPYVHQKTVGGDPDLHTNAQFNTERTGHRVTVKRWMPNSNPPPFFRAVHPFKDKIDRWQEVEFVPGIIRVWTGGTDAGASGHGRTRVGGVQFSLLQGITPSTPTACYCLSTIGRNFHLDSKAMGNQVFQGVHATLLEDKRILEAQQRGILNQSDREFVDIRVDAAPLHARRIIDELLSVD